MPLEIEVKFLVRGHARVRERLLAAGGRVAHRRVLEVNLRFDDARGTLSGENTVLRLRRDERARITLKRGPADGAVSEAKRLEELETEVGDLETARAILEAIGFEVVVVYEKYRETFELGPVEVVLDELPYGLFVELEGPTDDALRDAAQGLRLNWQRRYSGSYIALFDRVRKARGLLFRDLTFENFNAAPVTPADLGLEPAD